MTLISHYLHSGYYVADQSEHFAKPSWFEQSQDRRSGYTGTFEAPNGCDEKHARHSYVAP